MSIVKNEAAEIVETAEASLLEIIDHVLNKGVVITGEVMLGVAGVDLVYLRISAILCAADRVDPWNRAEGQHRLTTRKKG